MNKTPSESPDLRLAVRCPNGNCRKYPRRRIRAWVREIFGRLPADVIVETERCYWCGQEFQVTAGAYRDATPDSLKRAA